MPAKRYKFNILAICFCCWLYITPPIVLAAAGDSAPLPQNAQALETSQRTENVKAEGKGIVEARDADIVIDSSRDAVNDGATTTTTKTTTTGLPPLLNPRFEYNNNEWRPVGRGDPLKNDPTFDYSPPTLDRVRYWGADEDDNKNKTKNKNNSISTTNSDSAGIDGGTIGSTSLRQWEKEKISQRKVHSGQNEVHLLGMPLGRNGVGVQHSHAHGPAAYPAAAAQPLLHPYMMKNMVKSGGEVPLLQPKYNTAMRRSYFSTQQQQQQHHQQHQPQQQQQMPHTRLMPPPMQNNIPPSQTSIEYRHHMPSAASSGMPGMITYTGKPLPGASSSSSFMTTTAAHSKSHSYSTPVTPLWMQQQQHHHYGTGSGTTTKHSNHYNMGNSSPHYMNRPNSVHQQPSNNKYDPYHQETVNYVSYSRPSGPGSGPLSGAVRPHQNAIKLGSTASRKPWLHELLQKEVVIKSPPRETTPRTTTATTYKPVSFVTSTTSGSSTASTMRPSTTKSNSSTVVRVSEEYSGLSHDGPLFAYASTSLYITPPPTKYMRPTSMATPRPVMTPISTIRSTSASTIASMTTRPTNRPTTPMPIRSSTAFLTTRTPEPTSTRLLIPNTSNLLHRPTVAPLEVTTKYGYQSVGAPNNNRLLGPMYLIIEGHSKVKKYGKNEFDPHLPKIVPIIPKREPVVRVDSNSGKRGTPETFQVQHLHTKTTTTTTMTTPTTTTTPTSTTIPVKVKDKSSPPPPKFKLINTTIRPISTSTQMTPASSTTLIAPNVMTNGEPEGIHEEPSASAMQGLLSLLDSSLDNFFGDEKSTNQSTKIEKPMIFVTTARTILKPVLTTATPLIPSMDLDARVSSNSDDYDEILATDEKKDSSTKNLSVPELRQVFDYDQLPEARRKELNLKKPTDRPSEELYEEYDEADGLPVEEYEDGGQQWIKRIDTLISGEDDDNDDDELIDSVDDDPHNVEESHEEDVNVSDLLVALGRQASEPNQT